MYKKKLINLCAVTLAVSLSLAPAVTVCAEDEHVPADTWEKNSHEVVTHKGDVVNDSHQWSTVYAEGENTLVIQEGNATNKNDEWRGACGINEGTTVVDGNVTGGFGAGSYNDGTLVVNGDVTGRATDGLITNRDSYAGVSGNIDAKDEGIKSDGTSTVIVEGNVSAKTTGITINISESTGMNGVDDNEDLIVVEGSVSASTGLEINNVSEDVSNLPTIIVYELNSENPVVVNSENEELQQKVMDSIQYIVKNKSTSKVTVVDGLKKTTITKIATVNEDRSSETKDIDLLTTTLNNAFTVLVDEGYELTAGTNVDMVNNGDGTYTITLKSSKGGVTLSARLIKVASPASTEGSSYQEKNESEDTFEPFIFATFTVTNNTLPEVLGATRDGGANEEVVDYSSRPVVKIASGPLTAFEYKATFIKTMKEAPKNAIVRLETSMPSCFDKMMLDALAERSDIILEVVFPVNGEKVTAVIPAGYDVMSLLDENGYCGYLNLLAVFGNAAL